MKREICSKLAVIMAAMLTTSTALGASSEDAVGRQLASEQAPSASMDTVWQGLTLEQGTRLIGGDLVPLMHVRLQWDGELLDWLRESYSADSAVDEHYLDDTVASVTMPDGKAALSFLSWEGNGFFRNVLVADGETVTLYRTPTGSANRDGIPMFEQALGITLPTTAYADSELEYAARRADNNDLAGLSASEARSPLAASGFGTYWAASMGSPSTAMVRTATIPSNPITIMDIEPVLSGSASNSRAATSRRSSIDKSRAGMRIPTIPVLSQRG